MSERIAGLVARYSVVRQVPKRCVTCGVEWTGYVFGAPPASEVFPVSGWCDACVEREEAHAKALETRAPVGLPSVVELSVPQEPGE